MSKGLSERRLNSVGRSIAFKCYRWRFYLSTFFPFFYFLSFITLSGWPSNVFRRFGRRYSFNNWSRDLAFSFPNLYSGVKSAKFGVVFNIAQFEPPVFENAARYPNSATTWHNLSASIIAIIQARISCWIITEPSAACNTYSRSLGQILKSQ